MADLLIYFSILLAGQCDVSLNSIAHYEDEALRAHARQDLATLHSSLECLIENQGQLTGLEGILATRFIDSLLGRRLPLESDLPYENLQQWLRRQLLKSGSSASQSFLRSLAQKKADEFLPFCADGKYETCQVFLPESKQIQSRAPLISAIQVIQLEILKDRFPKEIAKKIQATLDVLYADPKTDALVKKVLDELRGKAAKPLSMA